MEYTGKNTGAVTFSGTHGRSYRGGANPTNRFANVHKDDVERMTNTGKWRVVNRPRPTVHRGAEPVPPPKPALVAEPDNEWPRNMKQYFAVMPDDDKPATQGEPSPQSTLVEEPGEEHRTVYDEWPRNMKQYFAVMPDDGEPTTENEPEEPEETAPASRRRGRPKRA
jgi:hypothetical protein